MDFGDLSDNPFSIELGQAPRRRRNAVKSAAKLLALVAIGLSLTLVVSSQSQRWLIRQYTSDFDSLSSDQKRTRLIQIADLGPLAIDPLVRTLADQDVQVARTAFELLRDSQSDWTVLGRSEMHERHCAMVDALRTIAIHVPDDRSGWGTSLLQQTILHTVDRSDEDSRALYDQANQAIELLSLSDRAGPSILSDQPLDSESPRRLQVRSDPLPVTGVEPVGQWTDWPPPQNETSTPSVDSSGEESTESVAELPSVYRSSAAKLHPVDPGDAVIFHDINPTQETVLEPQPIESVTYLVESPMETFDDKSVMHWLGSPHQTLREQAKLELIGRGYDGTELAIATQIASGDKQTRLELVNAIARADHVDPRPWLLMMLEDESRDVKLRVVSVLATMNDPDISQRLRMRVVEERDPTVAARIRRVLDLR